MPGIERVEKTAERADEACERPERTWGNQAQDQGYIMVNFILRTIGLSTRVVSAPKVRVSQSAQPGQGTPLALPAA